MEINKETPLQIMGIAIRTTNENGQSAKDIPALWAKFMQEIIAERIPGRIDNTIYCLYTDYEKDHTKPYTPILGCRVENSTHVPEGMIIKTVEEDRYTKFVAKGNLMENAVYNEWINIWNSKINRAFTTDFEVYGKKSENYENAEVDIFIAVR